MALEVKLVSQTGRLAEQKVAAQTAAAAIAAARLRCSGATAPFAPCTRALLLPVQVDILIHPREQRPDEGAVHGPQGNGVVQEAGPPGAAPGGGR